MIDKTNQRIDKIMGVMDLIAKYPPSSVNTPHEALLFSLFLISDLLHEYSNGKIISTETGGYKYTLLKRKINDSLYVSLKPRFWFLLNVQDLISLAHRYGLLPEGEDITSTLLNKRHPTDSWVHEVYLNAWPKNVSASSISLDKNKVLVIKTNYDTNEYELYVGDITMKEPETHEVIKGPCNLLAHIRHIYPELLKYISLELKVR